MSSSSSCPSQPELKDRTIIVVFGASGDLAKKMTFPSLFALFKDGYLPKETKIVGYARSDLSREDFEDKVTGGLDVGGDDKDGKKGKDNDQKTQEKVREFVNMCQYVKGTYDEDESFKDLEKELRKIAKDTFGSDESNRVYYLALPPSQFTALSEKLAKNNKTDKSLSTRLVIEKPFGKDTESCKEMMKAITKNWEEEEIYRIDHFLGEEMVKSILHLRFANEIIDSMLNKDKVASVMIEWTESFGCEGRGGYFDEFGIIRDMLQNHFMQILTYLTMNKPKSLKGDSLRDEQYNILKAIKPIDIKDAILAQYTGNGDKPGYLEDESVENKESKTETFAEVILKIDNDRWEGVPFILKSGKALDEDRGQVIVQFREPKESDGEVLFKNESGQPSELIIQLAPDHKIAFNVNGKLPGMEPKTVKTPLEIDFAKAFKGSRAPDAYEYVIREVLKGNNSSFVREDQLIAAWKVFTPLLHKMESKEAPKPLEYKYGSGGPKECEEFESKLGFVRPPKK